MKLPSSYNYIAAFLTMRCCYSCSYCINWKTPYQERDGEEWIRAFDKIETDLPVTLCGGEPSLHKDFYAIINHIPQKVDLLTNLRFDVHEFIDNVDISKFDNDKPFAPIRASFHSEFMKAEEIAEKIYWLNSAGFRVGLYCVDCPENQKAIEQFSKIERFDFQIKPFLDNTVKVANKKIVHCRSRELFISPELEVYLCHRDLYKHEWPLGKLGEYQPDETFKGCRNGDECHPCDLKIKRDRFGNPGYCAVEIKEGI
jgi:MoaA/NifB/PqqE/SkfB family radical SAM enzyme